MPLLDSKYNMLSLLVFLFFLNSKANKTGDWIHSLIFVLTPSTFTWQLENLWFPFLLQIISLMKYDCVTRCEWNHLYPDHCIMRHLMARHLHWPYIDNAIGEVSTPTFYLVSYDMRLGCSVPQYLQVWRLHSLCGQLLLLFDSPHRENFFSIYPVQNCLVSNYIHYHFSYKSIPSSICSLSSAQRENFLFQTEWNTHGISLNSVFCPEWFSPVFLFSMQDHSNCQNFELWELTPKPSVIPTAFVKGWL